jgi:hypothetical protein
VWDHLRSSTAKTRAATAPTRSLTSHSPSVPVVARGLDAPAKLPFVNFYRIGNAARQIHGPAHKALRRVTLNLSS